MRRQTPIAHLLYSHLFPQPSPNDPPNFSAHLARNLVPEVRIEVATYYGDLNSTEARYPGLNYCYPPHRMRLGRFKHHRRLFDAFDTLNLTYQEIQDFCCWEGTKWARERYEKDEGVKVADTTGDNIGQFVDRRLRKAYAETRRGSITRKTDISIVVEDNASRASRHILQTPAEEPEDAEMSDSDSDSASSASESTASPQEPSVEAAARHAHIEELELRRAEAIRARIVAAYRRGDQLPPEIEQLLKEQSERGDFGLRSLDLSRLVGSGRQVVVQGPPTQVLQSVSSPTAGTRAAA